MSGCMCVLALESAELGVSAADVLAGVGAVDVDVDVDVVVVDVVVVVAVVAFVVAFVVAAAAVQDVAALGQSFCVVAQPPFVIFPPCPCSPV